ncbi:ribosome recycling factor family protein [Photobacterium chitinilyticum]|uniref:ribosome recycling factor family protein n=1 Tax=Photobacterium chitinilyticum TaxID=2485123 RepID=UPI003D0F0543
MMENIIITHLPALIHRVGGDNVKKAKLVALDCDCELKRVRRSRHWQVAGDACALNKFLDRLRISDYESMQFLIRKIDERLTEYNDKLEPLEGRLKRLVLEAPNITLAELMQVTNCSIAEARLARFNADSLADP